MKKETLTEKATRSLRRAVGKVVRERGKSGEPIAVWKDGKATWEYPGTRLKAKRPTPTA